MPAVPTACSAPGPDPVHGGPMGRIPGSLNVPYTALFAADGTYRPPEQLARGLCRSRRRSCAPRHHHLRQRSDRKRPAVRAAPHRQTRYRRFTTAAGGEWAADPANAQDAGALSVSSGSGDKPIKARKRVLYAAAGGRKWTGRVVNPPPVLACSSTIENPPGDAERRCVRASPTPDGQFFYGRRRRRRPIVGTGRWPPDCNLSRGAHGTVHTPAAWRRDCREPAGGIESPGTGCLMADNAYHSLAPHGDRPAQGDSGVTDPLFSIRSDLWMPMARLFADPGPRPCGSESPGSLTFEFCDVTVRWPPIAREHDAVQPDRQYLGPSPLGFASLSHGCDVTMMTCPEHRRRPFPDLMMGSARCGRRAWYRGACAASRKDWGRWSRPIDAALAERGLRTMAVAASKRKTRSALENRAMARSAAAGGARAVPPCCHRDPGHALWQRDFTGGLRVCFGFGCWPATTGRLRRGVVDCARPVRHRL